MMSRKWIFSMLVTVLFAATTVSASTTRVGNGDEGDDLEGGSLITEGPIFEARKAAVETLRALNVQGVAGLGFVLAEVENTQLILANKDVRPLSTEGDWETSPDREKAFARTFPEPHAPTRFFPAALTLTREQLIALHTHEALHRALPPDVRENEEKVAILTMALTSPSATFDRVNRIAQTVLSPPPSSRTFLSSFSTTKTRSAPTARPQRKSQMHAEHLYYGLGDSGFMTFEKLGGEVSLFDHLEAFGYETDPRLSIDGYLMNGYGGFVMGPMSFNLQAPAFYDVGKSAGPFVRISLRSLDSELVSRSSTQRDVYTVGWLLETQRASSFSKSSLSYTLPDHFGGDTGVGAIWSFDTRQGWKLGRFDLGVAIGLYHALAQTRTESFSALRAGPEVRWTSGSTSVFLNAGAVLNRRGNLDGFQDLAGHGAGRTNVSLGLAIGL